MEGSVVTGESSDIGDESHPLFCYREICERVCPFYMSLGMTYDEFWYGEADRVIFYREAEKLKQRDRNYDLWLMGRYIYETILDCAPTLNPMSKDGNPVPYMSDPIPLTKEDAERIKKKEEARKLKESQEAFKRMMEQMNKRFHK